MKKYLFLIPVLALAGCDTTGFVSTTTGISTTVANILSHSSQACADLSTVGGNIQSIAGQIASANPGNASIQKTYSDIANGTVVSNSACQQLAASFKAEVAAGRLSPNSRVHIPTSVLHAIK